MHFRSQRNEAQVLASYYKPAFSISTLHRRPNHFICTSSRNVMQRKPLRHYKPAWNRVVLQNTEPVISWAGPNVYVGPAQLNQWIWVEIWSVSHVCTGFYTYYLSSYSLHLCQESLKQCCCPLIAWVQQTTANTHPTITTARHNDVKIWINSTRNSGIPGFIISSIIPVKPYFKGWS